MLKKAILGTVMFMMVLVSGASADNYTVPYGYKFTQSSGYGALKIYKKGNTYVSIINLDKAKLNFGNVEKVSSNKFLKNSMNTWWNDYRNNKTLAMYNGQFFSMNGWGSSDYTTLSFPVRSYWRTINSSKDSGTLKTLYVDSRGKVKIFPKYQSSYLRYSKELIVGLSPYVNKGYTNKTGRFYMMGIPRKSSEKSYYRRDMKYLLFFNSISSDQNSMMNEIHNWNGKDENIIMMDGSGSSQMRAGSLKVYGNGFPKYRHLPSVISIEKK